MADMFKSCHMKSLFNNKRILLFGDSNVRTLYKDLVWLCRNDCLIPDAVLRRKLEFSYLGDTLIKRSELTKGRSFLERRLFEHSNITLEFCFITRCLCAQVSETLSLIKSGRAPAPDVIYMNSCLWDVTRWGPNGVADYKKNMRDLMELLKNSLPPETLFIWGTAMPTGKIMKGGLIIKQIDFMQSTMRVEILEANKFTKDLVSSYGFDVLDVHYFLHSQVYRRCDDGVHYMPTAVRLFSNLLLTHCAISWDRPLPGFVQNSILSGACEKGGQGCVGGHENLVSNLENIANNLQAGRVNKKAKKRFNAAQRKTEEKVIKRQMKNQYKFQQPPRQKNSYHPYRR